jgi:hypothetical protein
MSLRKPSSRSAWSQCPIAMFVGLLVPPLLSQLALFGRSTRDRLSISMAWDICSSDRLFVYLLGEGALD